MKAKVMLLSIALVVLALAGPTTTSDASQPNSTRVKLYTGVIGSDDYIWGTAGPSLPTDAWALHSNMPSAMMDNTAASNDQYGFAITGYNTGNPRFLYRHATGGTTWTTMAAPPLEMSNGGAAIVGDTLYYCGGYSYGTSGTVDTLLKYSISGDNWTAAPGPFTGTTYNWQPLIVACGGKVYYISGCNQPGATSPSRQTWAYTPGAGWARMADMNTGSVFMAGWAYHDTIWVAGGNANNIGLSRTEFYDPVADTWILDNTKFPALPYGVWGCCGAIVTSANTGYVAGGVDAGGSLTDSVCFFDYGARAWNVGDELYQRIYRGAAAGGADGKAITYGGSTGGFTPTTICQFNQLSSGNANDVGMNAIVAPGAIISPSNITPKARIKNFGTAAQSNIPVYCWIDSAGTRVYDHTVTYPGPLASGATADVDFTPQWRAVGGTYNVKMFTALAADENRANDSMASTAQVMTYTIDWFQSDTIRPDRVSRTACIAHDGKLHVICGNCFTHTSHANDQIYDTVANTWSDGLAHPAGGGVGVHNHDAVRVGDVIWVGGGSSGSGFYDNLTKLDLGANTWTVATAMPQTSLLYYSLGAYPDSGWVYLFGGSPSGTSVIPNAYRYSPVTNQWTALPNMPGPRKGAMVATVGDTIYVIGGMTGPDYTSTRGTVLKYSVLGNTWTSATDTMPDKLGWGRAAVYSPGFSGERIYVFGGYRAGTIVNACWRYDVEAGSWTADRNMLITNRSFGGSIEGNYIWVAGGYNTVILPNVLKGIIFETGVEEGQPSIGWSEVTSAPTFVRGAGRISFNLAKAGSVKLSVFNASGRLVTTLVDRAMGAGSQTVTWNGTDANGRRVARGSYFYRLTVDGETTASKAIVLN